jgi:hypothetical protein
MLVLVGVNYDDRIQLDLSLEKSTWEFKRKHSRKEGEVSYLSILCLKGKEEGNWSKLASIIPKLDPFTWELAPHRRVPYLAHLGMIDEEVYDDKEFFKWFKELVDYTNAVYNNKEFLDKGDCGDYCFP